MIQLWLGGKRIDSIPMLQSQFASVASEEQEKLCKELLRKKEIFLEWLANCPETKYLDKGIQQETLKKKGIEMLQHCSERLMHSANKTPQEEDFEAIAQICKIRPEVFKKSYQIYQEEQLNQDAFDWNLLQGERWYQTDTHLQETLRRLPPEQFVFSSDALSNILTWHAEKEPEKVLDLYLLNINKPIWINTLEYLRNLRLVGFGNPRVFFDSGLRNSHLDMKTNNLRFEGFTLCHSGVCLANSAGRLYQMDYFPKKVNLK